MDITRCLERDKSMYFRAVRPQCGTGLVCISNCSMACTRY